ncbi:SRPBCC family protein [Lacinutrix jangbogonensis]|uniref:SRPBCC family protein n=1 Tax=Lacinutrix jangbogonensis TaxID=1469557 RepID=UPI00053EF84C|nr:SRPBCC domain-containing protein [Lacinutrix jangbogonensis]
MNNLANTITITLEIQIEANINFVWKCLIEDIGKWWRTYFYTSSKTKGFKIEPFVGGRMYEDYGGDNGLLWANVIVLDAPNNLELKGHLSPSFGGPAMNFMKLSLKESEGITIMTLTDTTFGNVSESTRNQLSSGWKMLYEDTFKKYVESNTQYYEIFTCFNSKSFTSVFLL